MSNKIRYSVDFWTGRSWMGATSVLTSQDAESAAWWLVRRRRDGEKYLNHYVEDVRVRAMRGDTVVRTWYR